jgi:hypothetical protein
LKFYEVYMNYMESIFLSMTMIKKSVMLNK